MAYVNKLGTFDGQKSLICPGNTMISKDLNKPKLRYQSRRGFEFVANYYATHVLHQKQAKQINKNNFQEFLNF